MIWGIETRATIPSERLKDFEEELFSLGFAGSLTFSGVGIFPNGIIVRQSKRRENDSVSNLEFSYPPFKFEDETLKNIVNQYSVFFNMIKKYDGNPYPWYINMEKIEEKINSYKNLKFLQGVIRSSINPIHVTTERYTERYSSTSYFLLSSLGNIEWGKEFLYGPLLELKSYEKSIDVREFAKDFLFDDAKPNFVIRINKEERETPNFDRVNHFSTISLPHYIFQYVSSKKIEPEDFISILSKYEAIRSRGSYDSISYYLPTEDSVLENISNEIRNLLQNLETDKIPLYEIISNYKKFKRIAQGYIEENWNITNDSLTNAYALFLSEIDFVDSTIPNIDEKIYEVTNFPIVKYDSNWLSELAQTRRIAIKHRFEQNGLVNYQIILL